MKRFPATRSGRLEQLAPASQPGPQGALAAEAALAGISAIDGADAEPDALVSGVIGAVEGVIGAVDGVVAAGVDVSGAGVSAFLQPNSATEERRTIEMRALRIGYSWLMTGEGNAARSRRDWF